MNYMDIKQYIDEIMLTEPEWVKTVKAEELRKYIEQKSDKEEKDYPGISNHGIYKWWAKEEDIVDLLGNSLSEEWYNLKNKGVLESERIDDQTCYCIYVGITTVQSLCERLKNHLKYTKASSLRGHICKLKKFRNKDKKTDDDVNEIINNFYITYSAFKKTPEEKIYIALCEIAEINHYVRILNLKDNYKEEAKKIINDIRKL